MAKNQQLAKAAATVVEEKPRTVEQEIKGRVDDVTAALPNIGISAARLQQVLFTTVRTNPGLMGCTRESMVGALMTCAQLGLLPGPGDYVYLHKRGRKLPSGKWVDEVQVSLGYKGIIELARRNGVNVVADVVHERDEFDLWRDENGDHIAHRPHLLADRGQIIGSYAVGRPVDGSDPVTQWVPVDVIRSQHMARNEGEKKDRNNPWRTDFAAMCRKTAVRVAVPYLPTSMDSMDLQRGLAADGHVRRGVDVSAIDMPTAFEVGPGGEPDKGPGGAGDDPTSSRPADSEIIDVQEAIAPSGTDDAVEPVEMSGSVVEASAESAPDPPGGGSGEAPADAVTDVEVVEVPMIGDGQSVEGWIGSLTLRQLRQVLVDNDIGVPERATKPKLVKLVTEALTEAF